MIHLPINYEQAIQDSIKHNLECSFCNGHITVNEKASKCEEGEKLNDILEMLYIEKYIDIVGWE